MFFLFLAAHRDQGAKTLKIEKGWLLSVKCKLCYY